MAIPPKEELMAGIHAGREIKRRVRDIIDLLTAAYDGGVHVNHVPIPLTEDSIQPLIDEYLIAKAEMADLFQQLP